MNFQVEGNGSTTYVQVKEGTYLFPDGKVRDWQDAIKDGSCLKYAFASHDAAYKAIELYRAKNEQSPMKFIKSNDGKYSGFYEGKHFIFGPDHVNYKKLVECFQKEQYTDFWNLSSPAVAVKNFIGKGLVVEGGAIYYDGEEVKNSLVDKIFKFMEEKLPSQPLIKFLENLMKNPSKDSRDELYDFLESGQFPLTDNGTFLAYKGLNSNYTDCHTGTIDNRPGATIPRLQRTEVDENRRNECSYGYHVGSYNFANGFQKGRLVMVEVNPADVVAVPQDYSCQKCRVTFYQPVQDCQVEFNCALVEKNEGGTYGKYEDDDSFEACNECGSDVDYCECSIL